MESCFQTLTGRFFTTAPGDEGGQRMRSAEVVQAQMPYPVSLEAATLALERAEGGMVAKGGKMTRAVMSSRLSPSPKNYMVGRPVTAPVPARPGPGREELVEKWVKDGEESFF